jgi:putative RecB family exonuclease
VGRKCVAEYYEQYHPFDSERTIGLEKSFNFLLDEEKDTRIAGVIDRLDVAEDGTYEIHDYKTSGTLMTQEKADKDRQLALYHMAVQSMWPDSGKIELVWHYLVFGKEIRSRRTPQEIESVKRQLMADIAAIEADTEFRPRESPLCDWCEYQAYCPARKHAVMTDGLPVNRFLGEPGVQLVNSLADLDRKKRDVERDMVQVKEALVKYAREHGVEVIKGSDHRVLVRFYRGLGFPSKDEPGRDRLEALVKQLGLWDAVSYLSSVSLAKLVESGAVDPEVASRIAALGREEERPWVKLTGLRWDRDGG